MNRGYSGFCVCLVVAVALAPGAAWSQPDEARPNARDVALRGRVGSPSLSPDGAFIAYVRSTTTFDEAAQPSESEFNAGWTSDSQIWLAPTDGSQAPRQLTRNDASAQGPAFSPDGSTLAFSRSVDAGSRIHLLPLNGGEARVLDTGEYSPNYFEWSPNGAMIAFVATPAPSEEQVAGDWRIGGAFDWEDQWHNQVLYVVDVAGGESRAVTDVARNVTGFAWAPDSERMAVVTTDSADPYIVFHAKVAHLFSVSDGTVLQAIEETPTSIGHIAFSPDGAQVAYTTTRGTLSVQNHLDVRNLQTGAHSNAAASLDPTLGGFVWTTNTTLLAHVRDRTVSRLFELPIDGSSATDIGFTGRVIGGGLSRGDNPSPLATVSSTPLSPGAITVIDVTTGTHEIVVDCDDEVEGWAGFEYEIVRWLNPEGVEIEGLLAVTPRTNPGSAAPLMVLPHGGPDWVTQAWFSDWTHYFTARGFSVLMPNYRGGVAYGFDFYAANRGRLGEIEFMDIESGVDHLIATGRADPDRLVYGGWSWGGYLTAWTIGHTDRYRAAVAGAAVSDVVAQYVGSDINHGVAAEWEYTGNPWQDTHEFDESNPVRFLAGRTTPTLVIHGQNDRRVPFNQGLALYRALSDVGCETRLLAYPRESHGFRERAHTEHMLIAWAQWYLDRVAVD